MGPMSAYTGRAISWDWAMNTSMLDRSPDESAIPEQLRGATYNAFDAPALADADWKDDAGPEFSEASGGLTYTPYVGNSLRDYAGLDKDVTVTGALTRIEIWATPRWQDAKVAGRSSLHEAGSSGFGI